MKKRILLSLIIIGFFAYFAKSQDKIISWNDITVDSDMSAVFNFFKPNVLKHFNNSKDGAGWLVNDYPYLGYKSKIQFIVYKNDSLKIEKIKISIDAMNNDIKTLKCADHISLVENIKAALELKYGKSSYSESMDYSKDKYTKSYITDETWFYETNYMTLNSFFIEEISIDNPIVIEIQKQEGFDFRQTKWGFTKEQVKNIEGNEPYIDIENTLAYKKSVANLDCLIGYMFINDKLVRAKYLFEIEHSNKNDYISDYNKIKQILKEKYGVQKESNDMQWNNDLYKDSFQDYGFAISLGHLRYLSSWDTNTTKIMLALYGENYKVNLISDYSSKQYLKLYEQEKKQSLIKDF